MFPNQPTNTAPPTTPPGDSISSDPLQPSTPTNNPDSTPPPTSSPPPVDQPKKKLNFKLLAIVGATVLVVAAAVLAYFAFFNKSNSSGEAANLTNVFDAEKPILFSESGKYGYLSNKGEILVEPKYTDAYEFYGNYARVSLSGNDGSMIIDRAGNVKMQGEDVWRGDAGAWLANGALYNANLKKLTGDDMTVKTEAGNNYWRYEKADDKKITEIGLLDSNGKIAYSCNTETCSSISLSPVSIGLDEMYIVLKPNSSEAKYQIINIKNKKVVYEDEQKIEADTNNAFYVGDQTSKMQELFIRGDEVVLTAKSGRYCDANQDMNVACLYKNVIYYKDDSKEMAYDIDTKQSTDAYQFEKNAKYSNYSKFRIKNAEDLNRLWRANDYKFDIDKIYEKYKDYTTYESSKNDNLNIYVLNKNVMEYVKKEKNQSLIFVVAKAPGIGKDTKMHSAILDVDTMEEVFSFDDTTAYVNSFDSPIFASGAMYTKKLMVYNMLNGKKLELEDVSSGFATERSNFMSVSNSKDNTTDYYNADLEKIYTTKK